MERYSHLIDLLSALNRTYERDEAAPNSVHVKYRGDDSVYKEWVPRRLSDITRNGLLDPGFGSGPISFDDLDCIEVRLVDWTAEKPHGGKRDFFDVIEAVEGKADLELSEGRVSWQRSQ